MSVGNRGGASEHGRVYQAGRDINFHGGDRAAEDLLEEARRLLAEMPLHGSVPEPAPERLPQPSRMKFHWANRMFVGREEELQELARQVVGATKPIVIATGFGGIGKTQLAIEFAYRYGAYFSGGVFWINCDETGDVGAEIADCGGHNGMELYEADSGLSQQDQVGLVLREWRSPLPRLVILDNCEDEETLRRYCPESGGCRVIVTSRNPNWQAWRGISLLRLRSLSRDQSLILLSKLCPSLDIEDPAVDALCERLGDLPLALHLAGSYLHEYRRSVTAESYARELAAEGPLRHSSLTGSRFSLPTGHDASVRQTFAVSHGRLHPDDPVDAMAVRLVRRMAEFGPGEPVPCDLLLRSAGFNLAERTAEDALNRVISLSLVTELPGESLGMHRLIADFVREFSDDPYALADVERVVLEAVKPLNRAGFITTLVPVTPHLAALTDSEMRRADVTAASLYNERGRQLYVTGDYIQARRYLERACELRLAILGEDHEDTAVSLHYLGVMLSYWGDDGARDCLERALRIREGLGEGAAADVASSLNYLGNHYNRRQEYRQALSCYERSLEIRLRVFGERHPETAMSYINIGGVAAGRGYLREARWLTEKSLAIFDACGHSEHLDAVLVRANLSGILLDLGEYREAASVDRLTTELAARDLGRTSIGTLALVVVQLRSALELRELTRAEECLIEARRIESQVFGGMGFWPIMLLLVEARIALASGQDDRSVEAARRAVAAALEFQGESHPLTVMAHLELAIILTAIGKAAEAVTLAELGPVLDQLYDGDVRNETLRITALMVTGMIRQAARDLSGAADDLSEALELTRSWYGESSSFTVELLLQLLEVYLGQERNGEALALLPQIEELATTVFGDSPRHGLVLCQAGSALRVAGLPAEGLRLLVEAARIVTTHGGTHDLVTRLIRYQLGVTLYVEGSLEESAVQLEETLQVELALLGEESADAAWTRGRLAQVRRKQGMRAQARDLFRLALAHLDRESLAEQDRVLYDEFAAELEALTSRWRRHR